MRLVMSHIDLKPVDEVVIKRYHQIEDQDLHEKKNIKVYLHIVGPNSPMSGD